MVKRAWILLALALPSCAADKSTVQLPACWQADSFSNEQQLIGNVTLLVSARFEGGHLTTSVLVSPLSCQNGTLSVENPNQFQLIKLSPTYDESDGEFGKSFNATITGTVHKQGREYGIILSKMENLKPIAQPAWWHPPDNMPSS